MSFDESGLNSKVTAKNVVIEIGAKNPLIQLANSLLWTKLAEIILPDLKMTTKNKWWMGRPLCLRIHLGAYFLQQLYGLTDRQTEYGIKERDILFD